jgi:hypothetical protein
MELNGYISCIDDDGSFDFCSNDNNGLLTEEQMALIEQSDKIKVTIEIEN